MLIIKKFLSKLRLNNYTLILLFLSLITGLFKEIMVVFTIIIIHELGHYILMYYYGWNVKKINIYPFGGITVLDELIDKPLKQEMIITLMGPIFQEMLFIIVFFLHKKYIISDYIFELFRNYNFSILLFNLLPIVPLDGSKILNVILNKFFNFRLSYTLGIVISIMILIPCIFLFKLDYSYYVIIMFLAFQIFYNIKSKKIVYKRFILEKILYKNNYTSIKKVKNVNKMYRNKKHIIKVKNNYVTEKGYFNHI